MLLSVHDDQADRNYDMEQKISMLNQELGRQRLIAEQAIEQSQQLQFREEYS
jgi:hypothetical protein